MVARTLALLLALGCSTSALAGVGEWTSAGVAGAVVHDVEYVGGGVAVAITPHSIVRTTNHGASWARIRSVTANILANVAVNPANSSQVLVTSADTLLRSENGGESFTAVALPGVLNGIAGVAAFSHDGSLAYFVGNSFGDIWRSSDGGATWTRFANALPSGFYFYIDTDSADRNTVYVVGEGRMHRSRDGGATWSQLGAPRTFASVRASRSTSGVLLAVDQQAQVPVLSTDFGSSWSPLTAPQGLGPALGTAPGRRAIACNSSQPHVFTSLDDGASWTERSRLPNGRAEEFTYDPLQPDHVLAATNGGVAGSDDGGASWTERNSGLVEPNAYNVALASDGSNVVYVSTSDLASVYRRDPASGAFSAVARQSVPLLGYPDSLEHQAEFRVAVSPANGNTLYMVRDALFGRSLDGGASWTLLSGTVTAMQALGIDPSNPQVMYVGGPGAARKSVDGGASWTLIPSSLPVGVANLVVDPSNGAIVYALMAGGQSSFVPVYKSINSGTSWTSAWPIGGAASGYALALEPGRTSTIYLAASLGFYKSMDSGASWTKLDVAPLALSTPVVDVIVDPQNPAVVYVARSSQEPLRSVDNGANWTALAPLPAEPVHPFRKLALVPGHRAKLLGLRRDGGIYEIDVTPAVSMSATGNTMTVSQAGTVELTVRNNGTPAATRVRVGGTLPAASGSYTVQASGATCTVNNRELNCDVGTLQPASTATMSVAFTPSAAGDSNFTLSAYETLATAGTLTAAINVAAAPAGGGGGGGGGGGAAGGGGTGGGGGSLDYLLLAVLAVGLGRNAARR